MCSGDCFLPFSAAEIAALCSGDCFFPLRAARCSGDNFFPLSEADIAALLQEEILVAKERRSKNERESDE